MTDTSREATLKRVPYIRYTVRFRRKNDKDEDKDVRALVDLSSEVNAMHPTYVMKLGLHARKIDVSVEKIDGFYLDIFAMVIVDCSVKDKLGTVRFFQETFLLTNIGLEMVQRIFFLTLSKANICFAEWELVWRTYMAAEVLSTTRRVEIIDKKEFLVAATNADDETFMVHIAALVEQTTMPIHPSHQVQVAALTSEETGILDE